LHSLDGSERETMNVFEEATEVFQKKSLSKSLSKRHGRPDLKLVKG
jgi:hypothetical protein